jgi:ribonucleoside-diphosphate reductase alpha chain
MYIIKRSGEKEQVKFEKISRRILRAAKGLKNVDSNLVAQKVIQGVFDGVSTRELDNLSIEISYSLTVRHPEYDKLATRLAISALHKDTNSSFSSVIEDLYKNTKDSSGNSQLIIAPSVYKIVKKHAHILDSVIDHERDYLFDYFGLKTLERSYLLKNIEAINGKMVQRIVERPQYMWMRVAIGIHGNDTDAIINTYHMLSTLQATHATPTLFNACLPKNQLSSCFLVAMKGDSVSGIYDTLKECALISQSAGGIGVHIHNIRSKGSPIYGTGGVSNGIVPMLKNFNETARYIDQGGGKRKGSFAMYLEPWHADIFEFLDLRKNVGKEEMRARDLNIALWAPDLFFKRVEEDGDWTLMDPNQCEGLSDCYGEDFEKLYTSYESKDMGERTIKARELWAKVIESCVETGEPYILAKDACNFKSNQKNLGTIKSSNLCAEIVEYSDPEHTAVCNLSSISLPACLDKNNKFDFEKLKLITETLTENLNKIIDVEYYPIETAQKSNLRDRPIGIGIQGLATLFAKMRIDWESEQARKLNVDIFETMYYAFIKKSCELAKDFGKPYKTFKDSPLSQGLFQFDLWGVKPSDRYDWESLREDVKKFGVRNSLGIALMPTASTSQILGNTECFEPVTSNIYKRSTLSGEFIQINKFLVDDLLELGLWNENMRQTIIASNGSIQNIPEIPDNIKILYKTVWEISQKIVINMAADRGPYVCQSQSMNLYFKDANSAKLTSAFFYAWKAGLKTLVYYTRTQSAKDVIKFTVDSDIDDKVKAAEEAEGISCSLDDPDACQMCSG